MKPRQPVSGSLAADSRQLAVEEGANSGRRSLEDEETHTACDASLPGRRFFDARLLPKC